jgi:hypothetical protein
MSDSRPPAPAASMPPAARTVRSSRVAARPVLQHAVIGAALLALIVPVLSGCTNAMLASARSNIAAGNYAEAHQKLETAMQNPAALKPGEQREVKDDLCMTEFVIGAPTYSLLRQHQTCEQAAREPGSVSGERLAKIDATIRDQDEAQIEHALKAGDIAGAVAALRGYERIAPNDRETIARWSGRIWLVVDREDRSVGRHGKKHIHQTLAVLDEDYPGLHLMTQRAFKRWVGKDTSPAGVPMLEGIAISGHTLELRAADDNLKQSTLSPEKFAQINDAFSVWCQCDGATHVASDTGLPVYLARLNPVMSRSEVLVLPWR